SRPPNAIRYALTTQARFDCEKCRSLWIDGSATFTMVWSRMIIRKPAQSTTSATQRRRSSRACGWIWVWVLTSSPVRSFRELDDTRKNRSKSSASRRSASDSYVSRVRQVELRRLIAHRQMGTDVGGGGLRLTGEGPYRGRDRCGGRFVCRAQLAA